jgi:putative transposase
MAGPLVAVGDGAPGSWAAVRDVWPETQKARSWSHKIANVLDKLPKRLQAQAKSRPHEVMYADTKERAGEAVGCFVVEYKAKYPKAAACLQEDQEHRRSTSTSRPRTESTCAPPTSSSRRSRRCASAIAEQAA